AHACTGRARHPPRRRTRAPPQGPDCDRRCVSRLFRALPEGLRRGLGKALIERDTVWKGVAVPCGGNDPGIGILVGARAFARRNLEIVAGVSGFPWYRLDERALQELRPSRARFRRLPVSGVCAHGRCHRRRPGLSSFSAPRTSCTTHRTIRRRRIRLSPLIVSRSAEFSRPARTCRRVDATPPPVVAVDSAFQNFGSHTALRERDIYRPLSAVLII